MKIVRTESGFVKLWLSARDTEQWANRPGNRWPCSQLSGRRLFAEFDPRGNLVDVTVNGRHGVNIDATEFNAITSDFIQGWQHASA